MRISGIYFYDLRGKVLIGQDYRGDAPLSVAEEFFPLWLKNVEENQNTTPILLSSKTGMNYLYLLHRNVYVVALAKNFADASNTYAFLHKLLEIFTSYFKKLEEESIRDNFVIIYELLSEMMDFGYPQTTERCLLQEYITQSSFSLETRQKLPPAVTSNVPWRQDGIKYRKNEVFLDVIECLNVLISSNGNVIKNEIVGVVKMKSQLSGMPDVQLGLNDRIAFGNSLFRGETVGSKDLLESGDPSDVGDVMFHQCVRFDTIENGRAIKLIPPDGEFEVMKYRLSTQIDPIILVETVIESKSLTRIRNLIKIHTQPRKYLSISDVKIYVPLPQDADTPIFETQVGTVNYTPEINSVVWKINSISESTEHILGIKYGLPSVRGSEPEKSPPISVNFTIPKLAISGLQIRYLKVVDRSGYQSYPWVRYVTKSGEYLIRTSF